MKEEVKEKVKQEIEQEIKQEIKKEAIKREAKEEDSDDEWGEWIPGSLLIPVSTVPHRALDIVAGVSQHSTTPCLGRFVWPVPRSLSRYTWNPGGPIDLNATLFLDWLRTPSIQT